MNQNRAPVEKRRTLHLALVLVLAPACDPKPSPTARAAEVARSFIETFAAGEYAAAARHAEGDVLRGVEVQRRAREEERRAHPDVIALFEKAMREHPPRIEIDAPPDTGDRVSVRAAVTTQGPRGPERSRYELRLVRRGRDWRVYGWERR